MHGEVKIHRPPNKYIITFGVTMGLVIVVSMFVFPDVWRVGLYTVMGLSAAFVLVTIVTGIAGTYHRIEVQRLERRKLRLESDYLMIPHTTSAINREGAIVHQAHGLNVAAAGRVIDGDYTEAADPLPLQFAEIVHRLNTAMIVGGQDSGKTTLLQWVASMRAGQSVGLDPHHSKLPVNILVGKGRDYNSIDTMLARLYTEMDRRYKANIKTPAINVIIDEWMSITDNCDNAAGHISALLTEGRKAGVYLFIGSHTDRARKIGLDGAADLKEGMALIYLKWNPHTGQRSAEIVFNREHYPLITPGPFYEAHQPGRLWVAPVAQLPRPKLCEVCREPLTGRQVRFCSDNCRYEYHNNK